MDEVLRLARLPIYRMKTIRILHMYLEWREVRTARKKPKKGIVWAVHHAHSHQSGNPTIDTFFGAYDHNFVSSLTLAAWTKPG